jgi:hypothetical protein
MFSCRISFCFYYEKILLLNTSIFRGDYRAGKVEHFSEVFNATDAEAALAAGIFHRKEVPISDVKKHLQEEGI